MEDALDEMMTLGLSDEKPYCDRCMDTMMQAILDKAASAKFESINFEISFCQQRTISYRILVPAEGDQGAVENRRVT